jgi:hypothetical protein
MAADVWGVGLTVLELFLGRLPIDPEVEQPRREDWKKASLCRRQESICAGDNRDQWDIVENGEQEKDVTKAELHGDAGCLIAAMSNEASVVGGAKRRSAGWCRGCSTGLLGISFALDEYGEVVAPRIRRRRWRR